MIEQIEAQDFAAKAPENCLLVHVADAQNYQAAHIPGAILIEPSTLVSGVPPATGKLPSLANLQQLFANLGYRADQTIVAYDDEGGGWAGRFLWTLDVIGHQNWAYLNGGIQAWHDQGLPLETGPNPTVMATDPDLSLNSQPIAEVADVLAAIEDPNSQIMDVRSAEEYNGLRQAAARVGHIPGAINLDWMLLKQTNGKLCKNLTELLTSHGLDLDRKIITHCQTHHRSGLSYLVGRLLGLDIVAYHGSWSEWGNRPDTPIQDTPTELNS